jgi:hypothetical protein
VRTPAIDDDFAITATMMMPMMQMIRPIITMVVMIMLSTTTPNACVVVSAFYNSVVPSSSSPRLSSSDIVRVSSSDSSATHGIVDKLIQQVKIDDGEKAAVVDPTNTTNQKNLRDTTIRDLITDISSTQQVSSNTSTNDDLFGPLLGYYNVSYTLTENPKDNPVGGKWTRSLWTVKRTLQHVLPPLPSSSSSSSSSEKEEDGKEITAAATVVAQVVNAIKLECLWGFVGIWVLLRGDAVPLKDDQEVNIIKEEESHTDSRNEKKKKKNSKKSPRKLLPNLSDRTVKVYFDQPKIGISLFRKSSLLNNNKNKKMLLLQRVLNLGPTSSVVLDTPYNDNRIRLGKGGTSGSQFVFCRINDDDDNDIDAKEGWKWVLASSDNKMIGRSLTKKKLMLRLGILTFAFSLSYTILQQQHRWMKIGAGISAIISCMSMLWLSMSTGGIETQGNSFSKGRG